MARIESLHHAVRPAFVALGSNLANPKSQVLTAFDELAKLRSSSLIARSSLYRSAPVGRLDQPDFINAVAYMETALSPHELLAALLDIERAHGRARECRDGPRTLDLDLLIYSDFKCNDSSLTLPHPRMHQRAFVLQPLMEVAPGVRIPGQPALAELLTACSQQRLERLENNRE
jgi:2-amino-4-hydroxy-6-hydroxymethyldihydropteridine diphosphokinase